PRDGPASWVQGTPSKWISIHRHAPIHLVLQYARDVQLAVRILNDRPRSGPVTDAEFAEAKDNAAFLRSTLETDDLDGLIRETQAQVEAAATDAERADLQHQVAVFSAIQAMPQLEAIRSAEG